MSFIWPKMLVVLLAAPLLVAGYVALHRQRVARAADLAAQGFAPARNLGARRHVPFAFFLLALTVLAAAMARPRMNVGIPKREGTVILAFDVSSSMVADDLKPTRIEAAKAAARTFVAAQPDTIKVGIVSFSSGAQLVQIPTTNKADIVASINRLTTQGGTSLGHGIFTSVSAIAGKSIVPPTGDLTGNIDEFDVGFYSSAAIVILSDGDNTSTLDPLKAADLASVAGVKIFPIGIGSTEGTVVTIDGFSAATSLDESLLKEIATKTDGSYFQASDEKALAEVYSKIDLKFTTEPKKTEVTAGFTAVGSVLLLIGAALSLLWFGRVV
jgi:Ca-activated chloride channel homolog